MRVCCSWKIYLTDRLLDKHLRSVAHDTGIPCATCRTCFRSQNLLDRHNKAGFHLIPPRPGPRIPCVQCGCDFVDQRELDGHMVVHRFCCKLCGASCKSKLELDQHTAYYHGQHSVQTPTQKRQQFIPRPIERVPVPAPANQIPSPTVDTKALSGYCASDFAN